MTVADLPRLRALISGLSTRPGPGSAVLVKAEPTWTGPERFDIDDQAVRVAACRSPLEVRAALDILTTSSASDVVVLLTSLDHGALGLDVMSRVHGQKARSLDSLAALRSLFGAQQLDPELAALDYRWLIDDLISIAPAGGWVVRRPLNGVLDRTLACGVWQETRLGVERAPETFAGVLELVSDAPTAARIAALPAEHRDGLAAWWATADPAAPFGPVVAMVAAGRADLVVPAGLALRCLHAPVGDATAVGEQRFARVRSEQLIGRDTLDERAALAWADAAESVTRNDPVRRAELVDAAERLLAEWDARSLVALSDVLPKGFDARLTALARGLLTRDVPAAEGALHAVRTHDSAAGQAHRIAMAAAAVAIIRRPRVVLPESFVGLTQHYAMESSWVDRARTLLTEGEHVPELAVAYRQLCAELDTEREAENRRFAEALVEWSKSEPAPTSGLLPLEGVLDQIVAPIADERPVLLVVCNGLALPVAHELFADLDERGWIPVQRTTDPWPTGVALLPTVTNVSRTSLLTGARVTGEQKEEVEGFSVHPALRRESSPTRPPVLFHKKDLAGPSGQALEERVRRAVADPDQQIVGVVVNAIDDHLTRGDQLRVGWDLDSLRPLSWLLEAANEANRVVIVTADHGHVLSVGRATRVTAEKDSGERWRTGAPAPKDGEMVISGPRVLCGNGTVIVPFDEHLHYATPKNGYHGGITPQEVLVPIAVFAKRVPAGWLPKRLPCPAWWTGEDELPAAPASTPVPSAPAPARRVPAKAPENQVSLFEEPATPVAFAAAPAGDWIGQLLASPVLAASRKRLPRPITDDRIHRTLTTISDHGGTIPLNALAARLGEPADTLQLSLRPLQRLLNVDGVEVLAVRADGDVVLNRAVLATQFEIVAP